MIAFHRRAFGAMAATAVLAAVTVSAALTPTAGNRAVAATPTATEPAQLQSCRCHGPDLGGKPGKTPSLHASGILKQYSKAAFEKVMDTGTRPDGTPVEGHMPVFHWSASKADEAYAYLKTLK
jgi:hypothetical protein